MILVERIGHVGLGLVGGDGSEHLLDQITHHDGAWGGQEPPERHVAHRLHARVDQDHVIELFGQILGLAAQEINRLAHAPELGHADHLGLHEAARGLLGIAERGLDRGPVIIVERAEDGLLLPGILDILQKVDDIVAFQVAHRLGQRALGQERDDLLAQHLVEI